MPRGRLELPTSRFPKLFLVFRFLFRLHLEQVGHMSFTPVWQVVETNSKSA